MDRSAAIKLFTELTDEGFEHLALRADPAMKGGTRYYVEVALHRAHRETLDTLCQIAAKNGAEISISSDWATLETF